MRFTPIKPISVNAMLYDRISITIYLDSKDTATAQNFAELKQDKTYILEELTEKKTLSQVGYAWLLIGRIAKHQKLSQDDIYREYVRRYGKYDVEIFPTEIAQKYMSIWRQQGLGWQTEVVSSDNEMTEFICYKGISKWSRKELSELIESIKDDCREMRIPTER